MEVPSIYLNRLLSDSAKKGISSLHLSVGSPPMSRVNNELLPIEGESVLTLDLINKIIRSFITEAEYKQLLTNKEFVIVKTFANNFRFRTNIFFQKELPSMSFNYIPVLIKSAEELGIPETISKLINLDSGLLIVAGTNDSGKTSTIASLIEKINKTKRKYIITLENPIEFLFVNKKSIIEQRQIGRDVKSYVKGLEHCLNEDVDLVYMDELRGEFDKSIPLILDLAAGNSLVILEVNADNSIRIIEKILNISYGKMSEEAIRFSLADILTGIMVQKLIPSIGGGMSLASEILLVNSAVKSLIREGKIYQLESIIQTSRDEGMISMAKSVEELIRAGKVHGNE